MDQLTVTKESKLQIFNHPMFGELEVLMKDGEIYFPGKDIAKTLEYAKPENAVTNHCDKEGSLTWGVLTNGGVQQKKFITLGNVSRLIVAAAKQSKNPLIQQKAKQYEKWIFDEIVPSVHKHGAYMTPQTIEDVLEDPDLLIKLATKLKEEKHARMLAESKNLMLEQQVAEYEPKATYFDSILRSKDTVTISQIADDYGLSARALNKILHEEGVQYKVNGQWILYTEHKNKGYTKSNTVDIIHSDGSQSVKMNTRWTQKGRLFIHNVLSKRNIVPHMDKE